MDVKEEHRNSLLAEAFKVDAEISRLQDHIRDLLQRAVDIDIQRLGYVDQITMNSVDAFNLAVSDSKEHIIYPKDPKEYFEESYRSPAKDQMDNTENRYITYTDVDGQETVMEGDSLGELLEKWKELEKGRDADRKIGHVYVIDNNQYSTSKKTYKYEIATGKDVTPVYLKLPEMSGDDTEKVKQWLKENGAEYNEKRNMWYITGEQNKDRFVDSFRQYIQETQQGKPSLQQGITVPVQEVPKKVALGQEVSVRASPREKNPGSESRQANTSAKIYYSYAYSKDKSVIKYTNSSMQAIMAHWKNSESGRNADDKLGYFYLKEKNTETGEYGAVSRYEIATGKDVTPVYLNLPKMGKNDFAKTLQYLRDNGAKFNSVKKAWYVTRNMDLGKFQQFIPDLPKDNERASVIGRLEDNKISASGHEQNHAAEKRYEAAR